MIKIFDVSDKSFTNNGDAVLMPTKAKIHKEDNGDFYLDITADAKYADYLTSNRIIVAPTPQGEQPFRINNPEKQGTRISFRAKHVFYDSLNYLIADSYVVDSTGNVAFNHLNNATMPASEFTVASDSTIVDSYRCVRKSLYEAIQVLIERWGGHLVRDGFYIGLQKSIGHDNGITIRYAKNLKQLSSEENWDDVVTKILPEGKDGILLNELDPSASIYIESATQYEIPYVKTIQFEQDIEEEDYPSETAYKRALVDDLRAQATAYLNQHCIPEVNYTLKAVIDKPVDIGDVIEVDDKKLNVKLFTNVISYEYDCLLDKITEVEFGTFKPTLSNLVSNIQTNVDTSIQRTETKLQSEIDKINTATASDAIPLMDGTGASGSDLRYSRSDHVHPSDTSKQDKLTAGNGITISAGNVISASELPKVSTADNGKVLKVVNGQWVASS